MPRPKTVYRGKRKYSWLITLLVSTLALLLLLTVWMFYHLQTYLVYDKDGVRLVLPSERETLTPSEPNSPGAADLPRIDVEIVVDKTDYSGVETTAGQDTPAVRAVYVPASEVTAQNLDFYLTGLGDFNALVLQLKGPDGYLRYASSLPLAASYNVNGSLDLKSYAEKFKARGVYLIAELGCLTDSAMAVRNAPAALKNAVTGSAYTASGTAWLDPYSEVTRGYLTDLIAELTDLGFDEILLSGIYCPEGENIEFSQPMTLTPDRASAVSSLALYLREQADSLGVRLSALVETDALVSGESETIGQDLPVFFKAFDRVGFLAGESYQPALAALTPYTDAADRILPVTDDYAPERTSYAVK